MPALFKPVIQSNHPANLYLLIIQKVVYLFSSIKYLHSALDSIQSSLRKLSLNYSISCGLIKTSLIQLGLLSKQSSFSKLIRMICVILSFQIGSNLVGVSFSKALRFVCGNAVIGIILVKKNAFNNWSYNRFKLSVTIRV